MASARSTDARYASHAVGMTCNTGAAAVIIGERIRGIRTVRMRFTLVELAEMTGIDVALLRRYERGSALPSLGGVVRLAFALDVDPCEIIRGITPDLLPDPAAVRDVSDLGRPMRSR